MTTGNWQISDKTRAMAKFMEDHPNQPITADQLGEEFPDYTKADIANFVNKGSKDGWAGLGSDGVRWRMRKVGMAEVVYDPNPDEDTAGERAPIAGEQVRVKIDAVRDDKIIISLRGDLYVCKRIDPEALFRLGG